MDKKLLMKLAKSLTDEEFESLIGDSQEKVAEQEKMAEEEVAYQLGEIAAAAYADELEKIAAEGQEVDEQEELLKVAQDYEAYGRELARLDVVKLAAEMEEAEGEEMDEEEDEEDKKKGKKESKKEEAAEESKEDDDEDESEKSAAAGIISRGVGSRVTNFLKNKMKPSEGMELKKEQVKEALLRAVLSSR